MSSVCVHVVYLLHSSIVSERLKVSKYFRRLVARQAYASGSLDKETRPRKAKYYLDSRQTLVHCTEGLYCTSDDHKYGHLIESVSKTFINQQTNAIET